MLRSCLDIEKLKTRSHRRQMLQVKMQKNSNPPPFPCFCCQNLPLIVGVLVMYRVWLGRDSLYKCREKILISYSYVSGLMALLAKKQTYARIMLETFKLRNDLSFKVANCCININMLQYRLTNFRTMEHIRVSF